MADGSVATEPAAGPATPAEYGKEKEGKKEIGA